MDFETAQARLRTAIARDEAELPLAESALLIAACRDPDLEVDRYLARIDVMVDAVRVLLPGDLDLVASVKAMNRHLIEVEGFRGNTDHYADPRNSFLNVVLDRKLGIPITLSVLYIEVGQRIGLDVRGISFPGHFLVRFGSGAQVVVIDPFFGGVSLSEGDLVERMRRFVPDEGQARLYLHQVLQGAPKLEILARMLRNLREVYAARERLEDALTAADQIVMITPHDPSAVRERGDLYLRLEASHAAAADYRTYLALAPDAPDAEAVRAQLVTLEGAGGRLN